MQSGVRRVYHPPALSPEIAGYEWSFLKKETTLTFADADNNYDLPSDFGRIIGTLHYDADEHRVPIELISVGDIRDLYTAWKTLVRSDIPLEDALQLVTSNPAKRAGIFKHKGSLEVGKDADLIIFDEDFDIATVIAKGQMMAHQGQILVKGTFEE